MNSLLPSTSATSVKRQYRHTVVSLAQQNALNISMFVQLTNAYNDILKVIVPHAFVYELDEQFDYKWFQWMYCWIKHNWTDIQTFQYECRHPQQLQLLAAVVQTVVSMYNQLAQTQGLQHVLQPGTEDGGKEEKEEEEEEEDYTNTKYICRPTLQQLFDGYIFTLPITEVGDGTKPHMYNICSWLPRQHMVSKDPNARYQHGFFVECHVEKTPEMRMYYETQDQDDYQQQSSSYGCHRVYIHDKVNNDVHVYVSNTTDIIQHCLNTHTNMYITIVTDLCRKITKNICVSIQKLQEATNNVRLSCEQIIIVLHGEGIPRLHQMDPLVRSDLVLFLTP